jgi:uncharacterized protein YfaS (alpha-2-macroglobulin family)
MGRFHRWLSTLGVVLSVLVGVAICMPRSSTSAEKPTPQARAQAQQLLQQGNFKEAWQQFRDLALNPQTESKDLATDIPPALQAAQNLGATDEIDDFLEQVVAARPQDWRALQAVAQAYLNVDHQGFLIAGKFRRGGHRGGGKLMSAASRDRGRALQLFAQGLPLVKDATDRGDAANYYLSFANALMQDQGGEGAWKLQTKTDLASLPDLDEGFFFHRFGGGGEPKGAPVDAEGKPVYHRVPASWEEAVSDGERWRWVLSQAAAADPMRRDEIDLTFAMFCKSQFGVQTMAYGPRPMPMPMTEGEGAETADKPNRDQSGPYAVASLKDDETIARLATGIRRFSLPDEFNYVKLLRSVADRAPETKNPSTESARMQLCQEYEDRRQYPRAAEEWRRAIADFGPGPNNDRTQRLDQIVRNWGRFEGGRVQPAGVGATLEYRYRNGRQVSFEAKEINVSELLKQVKSYLKGNPAQLDWQKLNVADLGYRLVIENQEALLGRSVATWSLDLDPPANHVDDQVTVSTPLQKAGAYLVTATMQDGNTSRIIVWLADTVIAKKQLDGKSWYYVADAVTGQPIEKATVEFFGWNQRPVVPNRPQFQVTVQDKAYYTNAEGQIQLDAKTLPQDYQWLVIATTPQGRLAYLGFTNVWYGNYYDPEYNARKALLITDRPVYRPGQGVKFKFWVQQTKYDEPNTSAFAGQTFRVQLNNPLGEQVYETTATADEYGGLAGEYELPTGAKLGPYSLVVFLGADQLGGGSFRVEEYKKPEFEVLVEAPREPVKLGDKVTATIKAKYYFGSPVTRARVKYRVLRTAADTHWHPPAPWDWFYGRGYWWFTPDYAWYPGWNAWGCGRPIPPWWNRGMAPPELVIDAEAEIGPDGTLPIEMDTLPAKEIHGDHSQKYTITAEVVDESRRTIVGTGEVLVARRPFEVFAWLGRGYYQTGDTIEAFLHAHTLDQKPVTGQGTLTLYRVSYNDQQQPIEEAVRTWELATDARGDARQQIAASEPGQYRLAYRLTDTAGNAEEGATVFVVRGQKFDGREFRFNDLELITDKREYAPGEKVQLLINTNRAGSAVLLFLRPTNGMYLPPKLVRLQGKSTVEEVAVVPKDMPNFFIEAITIANGRLHSEVREVVVPPEKRVMNVEVIPSQTEYLPGAPARVRVKLTGLDGQPFVGSTVLSVYDKSLEYISGGGNVPEIREFFWKFRRSHFPQTESTLQRYFANLVKPGELSMNTLGAFGDLMTLTGVPGMAGGGRGRGANLRMAGAPGGPVAASAMTAPADEMAEGAPMMMKGAPAIAGNALAMGDAGGGGGAAEGGGTGAVPPMIRSEFADLAFWAGAVTTRPDGTAEVEFQMPENLTGWKVKAWGLTHGARVGQGEAEIVTRKNVIVRLQAPRFFVEKDEVVLSANVRNELKSAKSVQVILDLAGGTLDSMSPLTSTIEIPAGGEQRVDWRVKVRSEGTATVRMSALTDEESDAMEMKFPVHVHGMLKTESFSGVVRPAEPSGKLTFQVPAERRISDTRLEVRYSPTLAGALVDALPYLVDYPYGCTEQTLNRFVPTVITQRLLQKMQLNLAEIAQKRTNLNAQELGDDAERAKQWKRLDRNPVFDEEEVTRMVQKGVEDLTAMQLSDGGWGWFSGFGEQSWPHTTAVVVHGLQVARQNDIALVPDMLERGIEWLKRYEAEQVARLQEFANQDSKKPKKPHADDLDALVFMVLSDADAVNTSMRDFLFRDKVGLSVYAKSVFGLALHQQQQAQMLAEVLRNIEQFLVEDAENQTAYLKLPEGTAWWYWHGSEVEANTWYLKLLARTAPQERRTAGLVKYLLNNRKHATYWNSTRDTAYAIEALAEYLKASGEDQPNQTIEVWFDGQKAREVQVNRQNLFSFDNKFVLLGDAVETGEHTVELRRQGGGPVYFNAYLTNFTLEDQIAKAGLEVRVNRKYYKLTRADKQVAVAGSRGQAVLQKIEKYDRTELENLATLKSGDLVEVELEIDSKNDYEYLVFEDPKAAGFEPVDVRSGYNGNEMGAYLELRDDRVALFVRALARGKHSVSYRLRAEIPGRFSALPTRASAMYAPELKGNSDELKLQIVD